MLRRRLVPEPFTGTWNITNIATARVDAFYSNTMVNPVFGGEAICTVGLGKLN